MSKKSGPFEALRGLRSSTQTQVIAPKPRPDLSRPNTEDDARALAAFKAGAKPIAAPNVAELDLPRPAPIRRTQIAEEIVEPTRDIRAHNPDDLPEHWFADVATAPTVDALKAALRGVRPIRTDKVEIDVPKPSPRPLQHEADELAALHESIYAPTSLDLRLEGGDELAYLREGMPRQVIRDLRRGRWIIDTAIDLHGLNRDEARDVLAAFMGQCRKQGQRCVRVIHGKGLGSPGKEPILKKLVAGWLMNYDDVLAYCQARVHDGGAGALMVLLKAQRR